MLLRSMLRMLEGHTRHHWTADSSPDRTIEISRVGASDSPIPPTRAASALEPLLVPYIKDAGAGASDFCLRAPVRINSFKDLLDRVGDHLRLKPLAETKDAPSNVVAFSPPAPVSVPVPAAALGELLDGLRRRNDTRTFRLRSDQTDLGILGFQAQRWLPAVDARTLAAALTSSRPLIAAPVTEPVDWRGAVSLTHFMLQVAGHPSIAQLLPCIDPTKPMRMVRWLDIPPSSSMRTMLPLAAAISSKAMDYAQMLEVSKVHPDHLMAWLNVVTLCGCLDQTMTTTQIKPHASSDFVSRLRQRLVSSVIPRHRKVVFAGTMGAGKTTAIRALSDIMAVSTEVTNYDTSIHGKKYTTVALDYGEVRLRSGEKLYLYGTPGQERFSFMWPVVARGALGIVLLIDHSGPDPVGDLEKYLDHFRGFARTTPFVVGVGHLRDHQENRLDAYLECLKAHNWHCPVLEVDVRRKDDALLMIDILMMMDENH